MNKSQNASLACYTKLNIIQQFIGLLLVLCVLFWIVHFQGGFSFTEAKKIFNWHPILMTIAFIYLFANAILQYRTFRKCKKQQLKITHVVIHCCIVVLLLLDVIAAVASHMLSHPPEHNFYSLHSWLGLVTFILYLTLFVTGIWSFLYPGVADKCKKAVLPYHVLFGVITFALAVTTAVVGIGDKLIFDLGFDYKNYPIEGLFGNLFGLLFVVYGVLVVYMVTEPKFKRCPVMEYEPLMNS